MISLEERQQQLKALRQGVIIEKDHRYIDLRGKKKIFSAFVLYNLKSLKNYEIGPDSNIDKLIERFSNYKFMDLAARIQAIESLEQFIISSQKEDKSRPKTLSTPNDDSTNQAHETATQTKALHELGVQFVRGVGPKMSKMLGEMGINTVEDLMYYFPTKYLDYQHRTSISKLQEGQEVTIMGTIGSVSAYDAKNRPLSIVSVNIYDDTGSVAVNWFLRKGSRAQLENFKSRYVKGSEVMVSGKVKWDKYKKKFAIDKAEVETLSYAGNEGDPSDPTSIHAGRIVPVYRLTEGINLKWLRRAIHNALEDYLIHIIDPMPPDIKKKHELINLKEALEHIHFPETDEHHETARRRLVFDELFYLQLRLALMRHNYKQNVQGKTFSKSKGGFVDQFLEQLPFDLTNAQQRVLDEVFTDMHSTEPMYRLLQGDVGSGKTVVAAITMLLAAENGYQAALMAPTEILAEQHYKKFTEWLTPLGLRAGLFVGKKGVKERRELNQNLINGQIHIAVGTHALIQDSIEFQNLGLVVVDEQHRFGVKQRTKLKEKAEHPEMLTMTATPIPRTLAMTLHGDLDVSVLDELPPGRTPIKTVLLSQAQREQASQLIKYEIGLGRQAYIVFPLIEESETLSAKAATTEAEHLKKNVFPDLEVGLLHGKMKSDEKEMVMAKFVAKEIDILVSTTVIEVGVDVPNATVMVIENADRFGLAQLHQLRGRVGRGAHQSYCVLVSDTRGEDTMVRLGILVASQDGFEIAEQDLEIRGPGEYMGTKQSGLPEFALADLITDQDILTEARTTAFEIVEEPDYFIKHPELKAMVFQKTDSMMSVLGSG